MPSANQLDAPTVLDLHVLYDWTVAVILLQIISPGSHYFHKIKSPSPELMNPSPKANESYINTPVLTLSGWSSFKAV